MKSSKTAPPLSKKRAAPENDRSISPPPLKRKAQNSTTKSAVANFFTPTSQKPKDRTTWTERCFNKDRVATLLLGTYKAGGVDDAEQPRRKIAAFDLDSTLITTASGKKFATEATDWKWWHSSVPGRLRQLYEDGYRIVLLTNQGSLVLHADPKAKAPKNNVDRVGTFKQKCSAVLSQLDIPLTVYAATEHDEYRKPRTGMWKEMCADYGLTESDIDLQNSMFVGDAGGRIGAPDGNKAVKKDFSCSDRNLAANIGIKYQTPEEFFLGEKPRDFARDFDLANFPFVGEDKQQNAIFKKADDKDVVLLCGPPGAGKSTFYFRYLQPLGYERVNQDTLKSKDKCLKAAADMLQEGDSVAVDNTNADSATRTQWVALAKKNKVPIRCIWFRTPLDICQHNDAVRSMNKALNPESRKLLPKLAFTGFASRFAAPKADEGFQDIIEVDFKFRGTKDEYDMWSRYWT